MAKVVAFLPVRCGSKSIRLKNIKPIAGQPLIYWNLEALEQCEEVSEVVVATDCDAIIQEVNRFGFKKVAIFERSTENAQDHSSTESVMLEYLAATNLDKQTIFLLVQVTSPLTRSEDFSQAIQLFRTGKYDSLLTCVRIKRFFWSEKGESLNYNFKARPRRQDFEGQLMENGAFYVNTVDGIEQHQNRLGGKIGVVELPEFMAAELDEPHDWAAMESLIRMYRKSMESRHFDIELFISDVDGVLTDAGMYYSEYGDELKKFNTHDGKAFNLMQAMGIKTAFITSENTKMVERRAKKLKMDYLFQAREHGGKLAAIKDICEKEGISLSKVVYIGDDINCKEALENVGVAACPANALPQIKAIPGIIHLERSGGQGVIREFFEKYMND